MSSPTPYSVSRSIEIDAPPERVFGLIDTLHEWVAWSPWERIDPHLKRTYTGPDSGVGATYEWAGNRKAGAGRMVITESTAPSYVGIDLRFDKPFPAHNKIAFDIADLAGKTAVTWTMTGELSGVMKLFAKIRPMDKMIGPDFERGLTRLRVVAEHPSGRQD